MTAKLVWYASGGGLARSGPYPTQIEAAQSLMVHGPDCQSRRWPRTDPCNCNLRPVEGAFVWPEKRKGKR